MSFQEKKQQMVEEADILPDLHRTPCNVHNMYVNTACYPTTMYTCVYSFLKKKANVKKTQR